MENVAEWREIPARPARSAAFPGDLHPALIEALQQRSITHLYTHQAQAWEQSQIGRHVAVVAGTASGKTLCYHLPILDACLRDPEARALYLFPTKALGQDQLSNLRSLLDELPGMDSPAAGDGGVTVGRIPAAIYDGDTPARSRRAIRSAARLVFSNPDMLHLGILPHHTDWAEFFRNLRYVVLDEAHIYRGVFGSHVANVLRRLRRVAMFYGSFPQFMLTSATLANPGELAERLVEAPVAVIEDDGAPRGPRHFLIYNPPLLNRDLGLRRSSIQESVRLAQDLLVYNVQTILFGRSRRTVEVLLTYLRGREAEQSYSPGIGAQVSEASQAIRGYRSGYLPAERREIERGLRDGTVRAVAATNALELGIDIGGMGASILVGYPGTIAAAWQQAGRAGRGMDAALSVLVATADPLDQFLAAHPEYFFGRSPEHALMDPDNLLILLDHLKCAAFELPFQEGEQFGRLEPDRLLEFLEFLQGEGFLHHSSPKYFWMADAYPAQAVSLRSAGADAVSLVVEDDESRPRTIGVVDNASALWMVHPQAVYLHEAQQYLVQELDLESHVARLKPVSIDYYTTPRRQTQVQLVEKSAEEAAGGASKAHGELLVTSQVVGFQKVRWYTHEVLGNEPLAMPATELLTTGYWLALDESTVAALREEGLWRNDPNDYGPGWPAQRERARQRDGFTCQVCGAAERGREHDVHHKVPFRLFASPAQANLLENLVTLCHDCHMRAEAAVRVRSGLAGLAYVMGHLAPFFLMCDVEDIGVHADPAAQFAESRPAVALYDHAPGGIGLSVRLFDLHHDLVQRATELVAACPCTDGCPSCTGPGGQGTGAPTAETVFGGKAETLAILGKLSSR